MYINNLNFVNNITDILDLFIKNIDISYDVYIIDNCGIYYEKILEIVKNKLYNNVTIIFNLTKNAEIGIFKYYKLYKKYKYYLNIHDSCYLINKLPPLNNDLYYLWKTIFFFLGRVSHGGYTHLLDVYNFINKYQLKINLKNDITNIFGETFEIKNKHLDVSKYFMFGMMFITTYDNLDIVYEQINHILQVDLSKNDRMCLETILGYYFNQLDTPINYIENEPWSIVKKYLYFEKQSYGR